MFIFHTHNFLDYRFIIDTHTHMAENNKQKQQQKSLYFLIKKICKCK